MKISLLGGRLLGPAVFGNATVPGCAPLQAGAAAMAAQLVDRVCDLHLAEGRIAAIGFTPEGFVADQSLDLGGLCVAPGLVDLAARLREPGFEYKATLESEMQAALAGGVTSLSCPPDTDPPLDEPGLVEMLKHRARGLQAASLYPLGAMTTGLHGEAITEMAELAEAGCIGFAHPGPLFANTQVLLRAMQYARSFGFTLWVQPSDHHLSHGGVAHSGAVAGRLGLSGVPVIAETVALHTIFELMRATGARVHVCRVSSAQGVELLRRARDDGLALSADVAVHHLHLSDVDIGYFDTNLRVDPPFRAQRDRDALRAAVRTGVIDAVCSDHTPVDDDEKQLPFAEAAPGSSGLELLLPLTLKWARESGASLALAIDRISRQPAQIMGVDAGVIAVGEAADLCIFDPAEAWVVSPATLCSQGKHTPFLGCELLGRNQLTVVGGRIRLDRRA